MNYHIKYIENNLVFNKDNECFAYYELLPYNYSFLSLDQKIVLHNSFRQLIAQNKDGKIHALQIATNSSIKSIQEKSKENVKGKLKDIAYQRIDEQTKALVSMIGNHQVDYRFFIGFKLMLNESKLSIKNIAKEIQNILLSFIYDVNHKLMDDYIAMPNDELRRYMKLENLLYSKISRRFAVRKLNKDDFGYIIEHLHGNTYQAYEDYTYHLPIHKLKENTLVKRYDLIKIANCIIEEKERYLIITQDEIETMDNDIGLNNGNANSIKTKNNNNGMSKHTNNTKMDKEYNSYNPSYNDTTDNNDTNKTYVSYLTISSIVSELEFPYTEIFYYQQQQFAFPIDTSMNIEIVESKKALSTVRNKKKELKDLDNHAFYSNNETTNNVLCALDDVNDLESTLEQSKEPMYKLSYVIRVSADSLDELKRRCNEVKDFYDDLSIKLIRPFGDMIGLHQEFIPSSKRYTNDYIQYVTSDFIASLGFGATQALGEKDGIYIGYNVDNGKNVYLKPSLAAQGVKGSVTNALATAFLGSLGGGKSFANNLLIYYSVLFGSKALIVDPKAERGNWKSALSEIQEQINIVSLDSNDKNKGMLDPYVIMKRKKDAESLAIDILTFLTGISSRDSDKFPILRQAIKEVTKKEKSGLLLVIDELKKQEDNIIAQNIAQHIQSFTDYDFAGLLFSNGNISNSISLDKQLNIIQVADLVLPDSNTHFEEYTTIELLSIAMLIVISTFALDFIHKDRHIFKIVDLDEAWSFLQVMQGKTLSNKLIRAGRAMNAGVYFVTQNAGDLSDEKMKNNIGLKFAFRSTDINEIKKTLEFFGVDKDDENSQKRLRNLQNGQCLIQDLYGRVGIIQIHPVFEDLFTAFDTRPPIIEDEYYKDEYEQEYIDEYEQEDNQDEKEDINYMDNTDNLIIHNKLQDNIPPQNNKTQDERK